MCVWYGGPNLHLLCPFIHVFSLFHFHLLGQHLSICPATQDALFPWLPAKSGGGFSTWRGVEETSHTAPTGRGHGSSGSVSSQSQRSDFNLGYLMTGIKTHFRVTVWSWTCCTLVKDLFSSLPVSFTLPEQGEHLDEVTFVELGSDEALKLLTHYKEEARRLLPTPPKRRKHRQGSQKSLIHHCGKKRC